MPAAEDEVVALHLWGIAGLPTALRLMATQRSRLRRVPGCSFAKLLGTGTGETFTLRDADPRHWATLTCWRTAAALDDFEGSPAQRPWRDASYEQARITLRPLRSRGSWAGRVPFGQPTGAAKVPAAPVASLTRARIRVPQWRPFWRSVPPVARDAHDGGGMLLGLGIGEAPPLLQGTFTVWADADALERFTYRRSPHADAIRRTTATGWYAEELFARFAVLQATGRYRGAPLPFRGSEPPGSVGCPT